MRMKPRVLRLVALLATQAACGLDTPQQYLVSDLRILAIQSLAEGSPDTADVSIGAGFELRSLVVNPQGGPVSVEWYGCPPPTETSPLPPCLDEERLRDLAAFPSTQGVFPLGAGANLTIAANVALAAQVDLAVTEVLAATPALCGPPPAVPLVMIARSGGQAQMALKRVAIDLTTQVPTYPELLAGYAPNLNPAVLRVTIDPSDAATCAGGTELLDGALLPPGRIRLCATPDAASPENYPQCQAEGAPKSVPEELEWQWYVTAGEIDGARFDGNAIGRDIALTPPAGQTFTLWVIVRDGRGGSGWATFTLTAP